MSKKDNQKHRCCECDKTAIWFNGYNPRKAKYYCDDCVPRGAVCNVDNIEDFGEPNSNKKIMWWSKHSLSKDLLKNGTLERENDSFYYEELDEFGRRSPSDNFTYQPSGFNKKDNEKLYLLCYDDILECIEVAKKGLLSYKEEFEITNALESIFLHNRNKVDGYTIEYNVLMSKFGTYLVNKFSNMMFPNVDSWRLFFIRFKKEMSEAKVLVGEYFSLDLKKQCQKQKF